jgi:hypothetical protein
MMRLFNLVRESDMNSVLGSLPYPASGARPSRHRTGVKASRYAIWLPPEDPFETKALTAEPI